MWTLIHCVSKECDNAQDTISVQIKDGDDGEFFQVREIAGRVRDNKWYRETFTISVLNNKTHVLIIKYKLTL